MTSVARAVSTAADHAVQPTFDASSDFLQPHENAALRVDLAALCANYQALCRLAAPALVAGVVKGDSYGLGAAQITQTLLKQGCAHFFVATIDEGIEVRALAPHAPIYVLGGAVRGSEVITQAHGLSPVLHCEEQLYRWRELAARQPCAVQIDTAINRLGLPWQQVRDNRAQCLSDAIAALQPSVIMTHMACADDPDHLLNQLQISRFEQALASLTPATYNNSRISLANSGCLLHNLWHRDQLVRPGAALYGLNPCPSLAPPLPLAPVAHVHARILEVRRLKVGDSVGYNATWVAARPSTIGIIGIGYADGIARSISNPPLTAAPALGSHHAAAPARLAARASVYLGGQAAPVVGRVSMDTLAIDLTDINGTIDSLGEVEVLGRHVSLADMASWAGTSGYEVLTSLRGRLRREYFGGTHLGDERR